MVIIARRSGENNMQIGLFDNISEQEKKQFRPIIDFMQSKKS